MELAQQVEATSVYLAMLQAQPVTVSVALLLVEAHVRIILEVQPTRLTLQHVQQLTAALAATLLVATAQ